jgi:hypothetical protein
MTAVPAHLPVPSHAPVVVALPDVHVPPQTLPLGSVQASRRAPLQTAFAHAGSPVPCVHAGRVPRGVPLTGLQTPVASHASH